MDCKAVVVDDGSGERYTSLFEEASRFATVLSYPENHGKGYALKTGLRDTADRFGGCSLFGVGPLIS